MLRRSGQPDNIPDIDLIRVYNFGKRIEPDEKTTAEIKRHIIKLNSTDSRTREKASAALVEPRLAIFLPAVRNKRDETPEQSTRLDCIRATYRIRSIDASIVASVWRRRYGRDKISGTNPGFMSRISPRHRHQTWVVEIAIRTTPFSPT
jgi:hypothetical protein